MRRARPHSRRTRKRTSRSPQSHANQGQASPRLSDARRSPRTPSHPPPAPPYPLSSTVAPPRSECQPPAEWDDCSIRAKPVQAAPAHLSYQALIPEEAAAERRDEDELDEQPDERLTGGYHG